MRSVGAGWWGGDGGEGAWIVLGEVEGSWDGKEEGILLLVGYLTPQQHASASRRSDFYVLLHRVVPTISWRSILLPHPVTVC